MSFSQVVLNEIKKLPKRPGVYIFRNSLGQVLYVGKAKSLHDRVSNYQQKSSIDWKTEFLQETAFTLEHKICKNELAALILEAQLIQAYQPQLNILLKNNQPFIYFFFANKAIPSFELVKKISGKNGEYFGPFLNKSLARELFENLTKFFGIRSCQRKIKNGCLYYHLGQCAGFCLENFDLDGYKKKISLLKSFFKQGPQKFIKELNSKIKKLNSTLNFEEATILDRYKKCLKKNFCNIEEANSMNQFLARKQNSQQIWCFDEQTTILVLLDVCEQHVQKKNTFFLELANSPEEFLENYYSQFPATNIIFTNFEVKNADLLKNFLKNWHDANSIVDIIFFSDKSLELPTFLALAFEIFKQEVFTFHNLSQNLQMILKTSKPITKIDCFDVSHHQELFIVASCVRFENGFPQKNLFRHLKIMSTRQPNDYQSLKEAVTRRYSGIEKTDLPDLVLIDGGKGQLSSVFKLFPEIEFASLAKREERIFRFIPQNCQKNTFSEFSFLLDQKSLTGLFLTNIRNTAHNFALNFHRKLKNKISEKE